MGPKSFRNEVRIFFRVRVASARMKLEFGAKTLNRRLRSESRLENISSRVAPIPGKCSGGKVKATTSAAERLEAVALC